MINIKVEKQSTAYPPILYFALRSRVFPRPSCDEVLLNAHLLLINTAFPEPSIIRSLIALLFEQKTSSQPGIKRDREFSL